MGRKAFGRDNTSQQTQHLPVRVPVHKVSPPRLGPFILRRSNLLENLSDYLKHYSIWISGPPGAGKTLLATQYANATGHLVAWYQLDVLDSDPATFFSFFPQAFFQGDRVPPLLPTFLPENMMDIQLFSRKFFRRLFRSLPENILIVLDNYQELDPDSAVNIVIATLVEELPGDSRLLGLSRAPLPQTLAQSHARNQIKVFDKKDLRFTIKEIAALLKLQGIQDKNHNASRALYSTTLGWAAGIRLILEESDAETLLKKGELDPDYQYIFDYFANVIFLKLREQEQLALMKMSMLPDLDPRIVTKLCEWQGAQSYLNSLSKKNYFTYKIHQKKYLYQFHPLFRRFLIKMAEEKLAPKTLSSLRKQCSELLAEGGRIVESIELLFESGQWELCGETIKKNALQLMMKAQFGTLLRWLQGMPGEIVEHDPYLLHIKGKAATPFLPKGSIRWLSESFENFKQQENIPGALAACADLIRAIVSFLTDMSLLDPLISFIQSHVTVEELAERYGPVDNELIHSMLRSLVLRKPDDPQIGQWRQLVEDRVMPGPILPLYYIWTGKFPQAKAVLSQYLSLETVQNGSRLDLTGIMAILLQYYLVTGQPEKACKVVEEGLRIAEDSGVRIWQIHYLAVGAACSVNTGNLARASDYLSRIEKNMDKARGLDLSYYHLTKAFYLLHKNRIPDAKHHISTSLAICKDLGMPSYENWCRLGAGITAIASGQYDDARKHFERMLAICESPGNPWFESQAHLGLALVSLHEEQEASAIEHVKKGFSLARKYAYTTFFFFLPNMISELCVLAMENNIEPEFVSDYISRWDITPKSPPIHIDSWPWPVRIYVMGDFRVEIKGKPLRFSSKTPFRPIELLQVLISLGVRSVPDTQVVDVLWPGYDGDKQILSLKSTLHRLRKLLNVPGAVIYRKGNLSLNPSLCWVDSTAFKELSERAMESWKLINNKQERLKLARKALKHYRGHFLPGSKDESWTFVERSDLQRRFRDLGEGLGRILEEDGKLDEAVSHYRHVLFLDPAAEIFYQRLMDCLINLNRYAEAHAVYEQCKDAMNELLGIEPSPETERLYHRTISSKP